MKRFAIACFAVMGLMVAGSSVASAGGYGYGGGHGGFYGGHASYIGVGHGGYVGGHGYTPHVYGHGYNTHFNTYPTYGYGHVDVHHGGYVDVHHGGHFYGH